MIRHLMMWTTAWRTFPPVPKELEWWTRAYCRAVLGANSENKR